MCMLPVIFKVKVIGNNEMVNYVGNGVFSPRGIIHNSTPRFLPICLKGIGFSL